MPSAWKSSSVKWKAAKNERSLQYEKMYDSVVSFECCAESAQTRPSLDSQTCTHQRHGRPHEFRQLWLKRALLEPLMQRKEQESGRVYRQHLKCLKCNDELAASVGIFLPPIQLVIYGKRYPFLKTSI